MSARPGNMEPELLRSFVRIAETGSFTGAAQQAGRTQSAISMQMDKLEQMLRCKLLIRGRGARIRLTERGGALLGRAKELLALHDSIWREFHASTDAPDLAHADFALPLRAQREALTMQIMMTLLTNDRFVEAYAFVMRHVEQGKVVDAAAIDTKSDELVMGLLSMLEYIAIHFLSNTIDRETLLRQRRSGLNRVFETLESYIRHKRAAWKRPNAYRSFERMIRDHFAEPVDAAENGRAKPRDEFAPLAPGASGEERARLVALAAMRRHNVAGFDPPRDVAASGASAPPRLAAMTRKRKGAAGRRPA